MTPDGTSAHVLALRFGLPEVAQLPSGLGAGEPIPDVERLVAACARADAAAAREIVARRPDLVRGLSDAHLHLLPELAAQGQADAVRLMVEMGWPVATTGGDWGASALNHAVFRGDAGLARFLLEHGASWRERHGYGDDASGTLGWASCNQPVDGGDWLGCAEALFDHGMPGAQPDPGHPGSVLIDGRRKWFSDEVTEFLLQAGATEGPVSP